MKTLTVSEKIILACSKKQPADLDRLNALKRNVLRSFKSAGVPTTAELLKAYHKLLKNKKVKKSPALEKLLIKRGVRTLSGVSVITVLTKPFPCPGKCVYCPSEDRMPKSYLSDEPAANRALALKFDPYEQVAQRIKALEANGHPTDKIELIVKGGTWNVYPLDYQYQFIARCFEACNASPSLTAFSLSSHAKGCRMNFSLLRMRTPASDRTPLSVLAAEKLTRQPFADKLLIQQAKNESAKHRIIGLTLETRPDYVNEKTVKIMRELGCTRVELGVQTTDNKILKLVKRGHDSAEVVRATELLKNYGFKVDYHLMPQLPGATPAKDLKMLTEIFENPAYRPDMIKIYPCTVIKNSELYKWLKRGEYKTYSTKKLIDILKQFKSKAPRYVRISRLIRDIPSHHIQAGNTMTNLRQVIQKEMAEEGLKCDCLRCREVGHRSKKSQCPMTNFQLKLFIDQYEASGGEEYFLSFEDKKREVVFAFCRLRVGKNGLYPAFIRELHTYGQAVEIGKKNKGASQHKGLGVKLIEKAEGLAKKSNARKLAVISGVGVRGYYKKLGYRPENTYMVKKLK